jgi:hypothetical protein
MMNFILTGFRQDAEYRVFDFEGIADDRSRSAFAVRADLGLIRQFGIRVQELPLLCRALLDQMGDVPGRHAITFTAEKMRQHAQNCAQAMVDAQARRSRRAPR